jgi:hypothetical protein
MSRPSADELERRFAAHGLPRTRLYPWWYRLYRALGCSLQPPVVLGLREHLRYGAPIAAAAVAAGVAVLGWLGQLPTLTLVTLMTLVPALPVLNWLRYARLRRRLGL